MSETTIPRRQEKSSAISSAGLRERIESASTAALRDPLLPVLVLGLAVALTYWPSSRALNAFWTDTADRAYTHGYLVLFICVWLIVRERRRLLAIPLVPQWSAIGMLLVLSAAWLWFWRAAVQDLHLLLLPLLLLAAVACALGKRAARVLAFPIAFLYFAMPVWSDLVGLLQNLSIQANSALIWLTGLPAAVTGDLVHVPAGTLEIADGCSGLHFFVVGLALAALYGHLAEDPLRRRLLWLALMGVLAIVGNWLRIFIIVVAAYASDMRTFLVTVDHYWFGWGVFVLCFLAFLWIAGRLDRSRPVRSVATRREGAQAAPHGMTVRERYNASWRLGLIGAAVALLCVVALPALVYGADALRSSDQAVAIDWPAAPAGWSGPQPVLVSGWRPKFLGASAVGQRRYRDERGQWVEVFEAAYRNQRQDAKLLGYGNSLLGDENLLHSLDERLQGSATGSWQQTTVADEVGQRSVVWARYRVGRRWFARPRAAQLWYGVAALASPVVSSITALRAPCQPDCAAAEKRLATLAADLQPALRLESRGSINPEGGSAP